MHMLHKFKIPSGHFNILLVLYPAYMLLKIDIVKLCTGRLGERLLGNFLTFGFFVFFSNSAKIFKCQLTFRIPGERGYVSIAVRIEGVNEGKTSAAVPKLNVISS